MLRHCFRLVLLLECILTVLRLSAAAFFAWLMVYYHNVEGLKIAIIDMRVHAVAVAIVHAGSDCHHIHYCCHQLPLIHPPLLNPIPHRPPTSNVVQADGSPDMEPAALALGLDAVADDAHGDAQFR